MLYTVTLSKIHIVYMWYDINKSIITRCHVLCKLQRICGVYLGSDLFVYIFYCQTLDLINDQRRIRHENMSMLINTTLSGMCIPRLICVCFDWLLQSENWRRVAIVKNVLNKTYFLWLHHKYHFYMSTLLKLLVCKLQPYHFSHFACFDDMRVDLQREPAHRKG